MSKLGCICGHTIRDNTDFLPYKAYIREDEDTQKPIELLAETLARYFEARQRGHEVEVEFIRQFYLSRGEPEEVADLKVQYLEGKPLSTVLSGLIFPFWSNYDRVIYECSSCGRLKVETDNNWFVSYLPETGTRHVLWSRHNHHPYGDNSEGE